MGQITLEICRISGTCSRYTNAHDVWRVSRLTYCRLIHTEPVRLAENRLMCHPASNAKHQQRWVFHAPKTKNPCVKQGFLLIIHQSLQPGCNLFRPFIRTAELLEQATVTVRCLT